MRWGKRLILWVAVLCTVAANAVPAAAVNCDRNPDHPQCQAAPVYVTFEFLDDKDGIASTCAGVDEVVMESDAAGEQLASVGPVELFIRDLAGSVSDGTRFEYERKYPDPLQLTGFDECHGPGMILEYDSNGTLVDTSTHDGELWMTVTGSTLSMTWNFDHYQELRPRNRKALTWVTWEHLRLATPTEIAVDWTDNANGSRTADVSGEFELLRFLRDREDDVGWSVEGRAPLSFRVTLTPGP